MRWYFWGAALLASALLTFFAQGAAVLLWCVLLLPVAEALCLLLPASVSFEAPASVPKGKTELDLRGQGFWEGTVTAENLHTGEVITCPAKRVVTLPLPHCGEVVLRAELWKTGPFGLLRQRLETEEQRMLVLPDGFDPEVQLSQQNLSMPDSEVYSPDKPGSDPGETFQLREYVPGDAIRQIHWKLSEKTDRSMVRDFGLPVVRQVVLIPALTGEADAIDAATEVFCGLAEALRGMDLEIYPPEAENVLRCPPQEYISRYLREERLAAAHVIVVGSEVPVGIGQLYNGNCVTLLVCGELQSLEGVRVIPFAKNNYRGGLANLEL